MSGYNLNTAAILQIAEKAIGEQIPLIFKNKEAEIASNILSKINDTKLDEKIFEDIKKLIEEDFKKTMKSNILEEYKKLTKELFTDIIKANKPPGFFRRQYRNLKGTKAENIPVAAKGEIIAESEIVDDVAKAYKDKNGGKPQRRTRKIHKKNKNYQY